MFEPGRHWVNVAGKREFAEEILPIRPIVLVVGTICAAYPVAVVPSLYLETATFGGA